MKKLFLFLVFNGWFIMNVSAQQIADLKKIATKLTDGVPVLNENTTAESTEVAPLKLKPSNQDYYKVFKPFMYSPKNLATLIRVIGAYEKNKDSNIALEDFMNDEFAEGEEGGETDDTELPTDRNFANVYLKSILFISPKSWVVWVNDAMLTNENNGNEENEFVITDVNLNSVTLVRRFSRKVWKYLNIDNTLTPNEYHINEETSKVELTLTLHPNQTFVFLKNEIIDGKFREEVFEFDITDILDMEKVENIDITNEDVNFDDLLNNLNL